MYMCTLGDICLCLYIGIQNTRSFHVYYWSTEQPKSSICHAFFEEEFDPGESLYIIYA